MSEPDSITSATRVCTKCGHAHPATTEFFRPSRDKLRGECRECARAASRAWQADHPGYGRAWWAAHTLDRTDYHRAYSAAHREEAAEYSRVYRLEHPEYHQEYRAEHPEQCASYWRNYRARRRGNGGTHTAEDIRAQLARQKGRCFYCGTRVGNGYEVDHVIPISRGGSNGPENLVIACRTCNRSKGAKHPQEFAGRLL